jgi:hypothetical protein
MAMTRAKTVIFSIPNMRRRLPLFQPGCLPQSKLTHYRAVARLRFQKPAAISGARRPNPHQRPS